MPRYQGHRIERALIIDGETFQYDQYPDGRYFLHDYAYDPAESTIELAQKWIDHQSRAADIRLVNEYR